MVPSYAIGSLKRSSVQPNGVCGGGPRFGRCTYPHQCNAQVIFSAWVSHTMQFNLTVSQINCQLELTIKNKLCFTGVIAVKLDLIHGFQPTALNIFGRPIPVKTTGRARLLPSQRCKGSAGASPSRAMNCLGKLVGNMFTAVASPASPSRAMNRSV